MPRLKRKRRLCAPPNLEGFKPVGAQIKSDQVVELHFEEYESIRLTDYEGKTQEEAAITMEVSRPTFTRIYEKARQKIARAFVESLPIEIKGGSFYFEDNWCRCDNCKKVFNCGDDSKTDVTKCKSKSSELYNSKYCCLPHGGPKDCCIKNSCRCPNCEVEAFRLQ